MMYYRRKILLALIELCGGELKKTDCLKLLFLFCKYTNRNYYDFFPYKYGGFSILVYQDKERLKKLGFLCDSDNFKLVSNVSLVHELKKEDQQSLKSIIYNIGELRGDALIKKIYLEFPEYCCRSEILNRILDKKDIKKIKTSWNTDNSRCLFTVGYEGITIDAYLDKLIRNNINVLIDVRKNPISMKYGFSKKLLEKNVLKSGLHYIHISELGVPSQMRENLSNAKSYRELFKRYEKEILKSNTVSILTIENTLIKHNRVALTCFEADYRFCHRHKISDFIKAHSSLKTSFVHL